MTMLVAAVATLAMRTWHRVKAATIPTATSAQHSEPPALEERHPQLQIGDDERGQADADHQLGSRDPRPARRRRERGRAQRFGNQDQAKGAARSPALGHSADLEPAGGPADDDRTADVSVSSVAASCPT
jgi:hypothetical protein